MKMPCSRSALVTLVVLLGTACADLPNQTAERHEPRQYRTGSNIAVKDYGAMSDVQVVDPKTVRQALDHSSPAAPAVTSGSR